MMIKKTRTPFEKNKLSEREDPKNDEGNSEEKSENRGSKLTLEDMTSDGEIDVSAMQKNLMQYLKISKVVEKLILILTKNNNISF